MRKPALGKGLHALIPEVRDDARDIKPIRVADIRPNPRQPRQAFDPEALAELGRSIQEHGVVQPVIVRPAGAGYELIAGERRWRAAQAAGLETIPAVVRSVSDHEALEIALVENLQRADLSPIEEAAGYARLAEELGLTHEAIAQKVGKSRPVVTNALRLLSLPAEVRDLVHAGRLSAGHAKVLLGMEGDGYRLRLARRAVEEGWSVRELEVRVAQLQADLAAARREPPGAAGADPPSAAAARKPARPGGGADPFLSAVADQLKQALGAPVRIRAQRQKQIIEIECFGADDVDRVAGAILGRPHAAGAED